MHRKSTTIIDLLQDCIIYSLKILFYMNTFAQYCMYSMRTHKTPGILDFLRYSDNKLILYNSPSPLILLKGST